MYILCVYVTFFLFKNTPISYRVIDHEVIWMKKKKIGILFALMFVAALSMVVDVAAYRGDYEAKSPHQTAERCAEMDGLDFDGWKELMTQDGRSPRVVQVIDTEEHYELFVKAREAAREGNFEKAAELRADLGLNNGHGPKGGAGFRRGYQQ